MNLWQPIQNSQEVVALTIPHGLEETVVLTDNNESIIVFGNIFNGHVNRSQQTTTTT